VVVVGVEAGGRAGVVTVLVRAVVGVVPPGDGAADWPLTAIDETSAPATAEPDEAEFDAGPAPPAGAGTPTTAPGTPGSLPTTAVSAEALAVVAARAPLGCASSATLAMLNWPADLDAPTLSTPTFAATAPPAAVTMIAAAPATVRAKCLFMDQTVETRNPVTPSRKVKKRQSPPEKGPEFRGTSPFNRIPLPPRDTLAP